MAFRIKSKDVMATSIKAQNNRKYWDKNKKLTVPIESYHNIKNQGCRGCSLSTEEKREPSFAKKETKILIVGSSPSEEGNPFSVRYKEMIDQILLEILEDLKLPTTWIEDYVSWTTSVKCRPEKGPKYVLDQDIVSCSEHLTKVIVDTNPIVIIPIGRVALNAIMPEALEGNKKFGGLSIDQKRGTCYKHNLGPWCIATIDPGQVRKAEEENKDPSDRFFFKDDIRQAVELSISGKKPLNVNWMQLLFPFYNEKPLEIHEGYEVYTNYTIILGLKGIQEAKRVLNKLIDLGTPLGFDIECDIPEDRDGVKPYGDGRLVTFSVSTGWETLAVVCEHPSVTKDEYDEFVKESLGLIDLLFKSNTKVLAHNIMFEFEWVMYKIGMDFTKKLIGKTTSVFFGDTMGLLYILPSNKYGRNRSLDDICLRFFGFSLKRLHNIDVSKIITYPIRTVLSYNSGDSIVLPHIYKKLMEYIVYYGLEPVEEFFMDVAIASAKAQVHGAPMNREAAKAMKDPLIKEIKESEETLLTSKLAKAFSRETGRTLNIRSSDDLQFILYDMYGFEVITDVKTGNPRADAEVLEMYSDQVPELALITEIKQSLKLVSDILDSVLGGNDKRGRAYVSKDNKLHTSFNIAVTATMRSSSTPNIQNILKRIERLKYARDFIGMYFDLCLHKTAQQ